jgi:hypothetical protein
VKTRLDRLRSRESQNEKACGNPRERSATGRFKPQKPAQHPERSPAGRSKTQAMGKNPVPFWVETLLQSHMKESPRSDRLTTRALIVQEPPFRENPTVCRRQWRPLHRRRTHFPRLTHFNQTKRLISSYQAFLRLQAQVKRCSRPTPLDATRDTHHGLGERSRCASSTRLQRYRRA